MWERSSPPPLSAAPDSFLRSETDSPDQQCGQNQSRDVIADLHEIATIMVRVCAPLAFLHGQGIVHRDLKPDNIFITDSKEPILMDFGLMTRFSDDFGRETLRIERGGMGTVKYMAPEQISGQLVDARADLYALGCILYQLMAGCPPFRGNTSQVISAHLNKEALPISQFSSSLPPEIDTLLRQLLAKDPRDRIGHADVVAAVLTDIIGKDFNIPSMPKPRTFLYRPGFVGRKSALKKLNALHEKLDNKHSGFCFIAGESGVGKTRLVMEFGRKLANQGVTVMAGGCSEERDQPLQALQKPLRMIADRCRLRGKEETDRLVGTRGKLLARYQPAFHDLPGQEHFPDPYELPWRAAKIRLFHALSETMYEVARTNTVLLVLDDLQWADELLLDFFEFLIRTEHLKEHAILILGAYRTGGGSQRLQKISEKHNYKIVLPAFDLQTVSVIISDMLAMHPAPQQFCRFLWQHFTGNLLFIAEYLRAAVEDDLLFRDAWGKWQFHIEGTMEMKSCDSFETFPLPTSLNELVKYRLNRLTDINRRVICCAAVIGHDINVDMLHMITGLDHETIDDVLDELIQKHFFLKTSRSIIQFFNSQIRDGAYTLLDDEEQISMHLLAAESMEMLFADQRELHLATLGYHWQKGGNREKARDCFLAGARKAKDRYAYGVGEKLYLAYIELLKETDLKMIEATIELTEEIYQKQGRVEDALTRGKHALRISRQIESRFHQAKSLMNLGGIKTLTGQPDQAEELFEQALTIAHELKNQSLKGKCFNYLARIYRDRGQLESAQKLFEEALVISKSEDEKLHQGLSMGNLGITLYIQGHHEKAMALFEQALLLAQSEGNKLAEGQCLGNIANHYYSQGQTEIAMKYFKRAMTLFREIGDRENEGTCIGNLANIYLGFEQLEQAKDLTEQALIIFRDFGDIRSESIWLGNLAIIHKSQGDYEQAQQCCEQAIAMTRRVKDRRNEGICIGNRGIIYLAQGDLIQAFSSLTEAISIARQIGDRQKEGLWLSRLGRLRYCQGRLSDALPYYEQALLIFQESGISYYEGNCLNTLACLHLELKHRTRAFQFYDQALIMARSVKSRILEAEILLEFATQKRRMEFDSAEITARVQESIILFEDMNNNFGLCRCWCELGHVHLAGKQSAKLHVTKAQQYYNLVATHKNVELQNTFKGLINAQQVYMEGDHHRLSHGELQKHLPLSLRSR